MGTAYDRRRFVVPIGAHGHDCCIGHPCCICYLQTGLEPATMKILCVVCREPATYLAPTDKPRAKRWPYCSDHGPGRGTPLPRISVGMLAVLRLVWEVEETTKLSVADRVAGDRNRAYGYRMVDRAIEADLITAEKVGRRYVLHTTRLGRGILLQIEETV